MVKADLFAELLCVQSPAFDIRVEAETMEAELRQPCELLLHRQLHVMSGDAFMVGDCLVVDERALREIGGGNDDATGALAVRRAGHVMGCSGRLECGYGFDGDWRLRKKSEELRKFRLHLGNVVAEGFEDLLGRSRNVFRIRFEGGPEGGKVGEALFLGDSYHLGLDAVDFSETELVYLVWLHASGGPPVDIVFVAPLAVRQRGDSEGGTAFRGVHRAEKISEQLVSRDDVSVNGVSDLLGQALLVFRGDGRRILLCRQEKGVGVDDALTLDGEFLVLHAGVKDFAGLAEHSWNLTETGDVVLVVLDGVKRYG